MTQRIRLFGMDIDVLRMHDAVAQLSQWIGNDAGDGVIKGGCRYVVTPNVDHTVMYQQREDLRRAYEDASLVLADGAPVVLASRLVGKRLPERVAGSDLVPALFGAAPRKWRVFLLGAAPGVADRAAKRIHAKWPSIEVVGTMSPPLGFERDAEQNESILERISEAGPDILIVGLGAPKQELWVHHHRQRIDAKVALCVGATIDFLAEHKQRSPIWMRRFGLEWLHRVLSEPRRLAHRYAHDARVFPGLVWREWKDTTFG